MGEGGVGVVAAGQEDVLVNQAGRGGGLGYCVVAGGQEKGKSCSKHGQGRELCYHNNTMTGAGTMTIIISRSTFVKVGTILSAFLSIFRHSSNLDSDSWQGQPDCARPSFT